MFLTFQLSEGNVLLIQMKLLPVEEPYHYIHQAKSTSALNVS